MAIQTDGNMQRMQEEAMRRAREMHARAAPQSEPARKPPKEEPPPPQPAAEPSSPTTHSGGIDLLVKDKDRTIILALLLLLGSEPGKGSSDLLLALLFLLM